VGGADFDELVAEAEAADVTGWDFSWLDGRATEERPPWGYQRLLGERLAGVQAALELQTGGGEFLLGVSGRPRVMVATEGWPPNLARATQLLHPHGVAVVAHPDEPPLPFADDAFDLVTARHPSQTWWSEIARVLRPGGSYLAQHVGARSNAELFEFFLGPVPEEPGDAEAPLVRARAAGLELVDVREARTRVEFFDVGAVVYFLRKVVWTVPDFTVEKYRPALRAMHDLIQRDGSFVSHSTRRLIEARKPTR
jgi:SAM-dependent methyltransferase